MPIIPAVRPCIVLAVALVAALQPPAAAADSYVTRAPADGDHFRPLGASDKLPAGKSCNVYVPAYSNIYLFESGSIPLAINLSIRNTDAAKPIYIESINYFAAEGTLVETVLAETRVLAPMATATYVIDQHDMRGGSGANFTVAWKGSGGVEEPLVEAVMAGYRGSKGLSFSSRGVNASHCKER